MLEKKIDLDMFLFQIPANKFSNKSSPFVLLQNDVLINISKGKIFVYPISEARYHYTNNISFFYLIFLKSELGNVLHLCSYAFLDVKLKRLLYFFPSLRYYLLFTKIAIHIRNAFKSMLNYIVNNKNAV